MAASLAPCCLRPPVGGHEYTQAGIDAGWEGASDAVLLDPQQHLEA